MGFTAIGIGLLLIGLLIEISLRWLYGLGNPVLYCADPEIGYLLAPNQSVKRMGKRIEINPYSMRSPAIAPERPDQTCRVLILGDSIVNGGWWTDQHETIPARLQRQLQATLTSAAMQVDVLNASANSWGPRNELAYLRRFGSFGAQIIVLVINTDDLFAIAPNSVQVGRDCNYPNRKPSSAWAELWSRYLTRSANIPELATLQAEPGDRVGFNLEAIEAMYAIAQQHSAHFLLAMTPLARELLPTGPRDYEQVARQRLSDLAHQHHICYIDFLPLFQQQPNWQQLFQDTIHPSADGNSLITQTLFEQICPLLEKSQPTHG